MGASVSPGSSRRPLLFLAAGLVAAHLVLVLRFAAGHSAVFDEVVYPPPPAIPT